MTKALIVVWIGWTVLEKWVFQRNVNNFKGSKLSYSGGIIRWGVQEPLVQHRFWECIGEAFSYSQYILYVPNMGENASGWLTDQGAVWGVNFVQIFERRKHSSQQPLQLYKNVRNESFLGKLLTVHLTLFIFTCHKPKRFGTNASGKYIFKK